MMKNPTPKPQWLVSSQTLAQQKLRAYSANRSLIISFLKDSGYQVSDWQCVKKGLQLESRGIKSQMLGASTIIGRANPEQHAWLEKRINGRKYVTFNASGTSFKKDYCLEFGSNMVQDYRRVLKRFKKRFDGLGCSYVAGPPELFSKMVDGEKVLEVHRVIWCSEGFVPQAGFLPVDWQQKLGKQSQYAYVYKSVVQEKRAGNRWFKSGNRSDVLADFVGFWLNSKFSLQQLHLLPTSSNKLPVRRKPHVGQSGLVKYYLTLNKPLPSLEGLLGQFVRRRRKFWFSASARNVFVRENDVLVAKLRKKSRLSGVRHSRVWTVWAKDRATLGVLFGLLCQRWGLHKNSFAVGSRSSLVKSLQEEDQK